MPSTSLFAAELDSLVHYYGDLIGAPAAKAVRTSMPAGLFELAACAP